MPYTSCVHIGGIDVCWTLVRNNPGRPNTFRSLHDRLRWRIWDLGITVCQIRVLGQNEASYLDGARERRPAHGSRIMDYRKLVIMDMDTSEEVFKGR